MDGGEEEGFIDQIIISDYFSEEGPQQIKAKNKVQVNYIKKRSWYEQLQKVQVDDWAGSVVDSRAIVFNAGWKIQ